jgi:hypothetical protein
MFLLPADPFAADPFKSAAFGTTAVVDNDPFASAVIDHEPESPTPALPPKKVGGGKPPPRPAPPKSAPGRPPPPKSQPASGGVTPTPTNFDPFSGAPLDHEAENPAPPSDGWTANFADFSAFDQVG